MDSDMTVTIELDEGKTMECDVKMIFEAGDDEREYVAVVPIDADDDSEFYFYRYVEDESGEPHVENIESDAEYQMVCEQFDELQDEMEYNDAICSGGMPQNEEDAYN